MLRFIAARTRTAPSSKTDSVYASPHMDSTGIYTAPAGDQEKGKAMDAITEGQHQVSPGTKRASPQNSKLQNLSLEAGEAGWHCEQAQQESGTECQGPNPTDRR